MLVDATAVENLPGVPCLDRCATSGEQMALLISLAARFGGLSTDPNVLIANAKCFECIPNKLAVAVLTSLGAQIAGFSGPFLPPSPPPPSVATCPDVDATAFLNAAGITDAVTVNAVCVLVGSLKSAGLWTLMDALYPFVGGSANSNALNLKNPATFKITWHGSVTFGSNGVTGDGLTGYGDTGFNPNTAPAPHYTLNSASIGVALPAPGSVSAGRMMGVETNTNNPETRIIGPNQMSTPNTANDLISVGASGADFIGLNLCVRTSGGAAGGVGYSGSGATATGALGVSSLPNVSFYVLAANVAGTGPFGFYSGTLSFATIGSGLTGAQASALINAVKVFNASLGRS